MMHSPCFRFLPNFRNFSNLWKIFPILPFPKKFPDFRPPKFLMTFFYFSHRLQIWNFFLFSLFQYISPYLKKIITSLLLLQISPSDFINFTFFYIHVLSAVFVSPYSDHDAFILCVIYNLAYISHTGRPRPEWMNEWMNEWIQCHVWL